MSYTDLKETCAEWWMSHTDLKETCAECWMSHTDLKETCAEEEGRAKGKVVQMLHESHEKKRSGGIR